MLDKSQRLNLSREFKWVSQGGRSFTPSFQLMYRFGENPHPLVGIALSKRSFKQAVQRNRAKRLASSAIALLYPRLRNNLNLVIIPKLGILNKHPQELSEEIRNVKDLYRAD